MPDLLFATAPDGTRLPVIDITHPAFAIDDTPAAIDALRDRAIRDEARRGPLQRAFLRFVLRRLARRSRLVAALQAARDSFLPGLSTYVLKLGAANLVAPYDSPIDRAVVASPPVQSIRLRLGQMANLLADGLAPRLAAAPGAPLVLLEIAGGPSADALNALLLLARRGVLDGRPVRLVIYDIDSSGPAFAVAMLKALLAGPLSGLAIGIEHVPGSWADTARLDALVGSFPPEAIVAAASEGGLFEYGSDTEIRGVLGVLVSRIGLVAGSVTRADRLVELLRRSAPTRTIPRGLDRFAHLLEGSGYRIARSEAALLSDQVLLETS